jgi:hypothetical protein
MGATAVVVERPMGLVGSPADGLSGLTSISLTSLTRSLDLLRAMRDARNMAHRSSLETPGDLRARLEAARLDLLALFRALDRMDLSAQEIPQRLLRQLFERDADYVEALARCVGPGGGTFGSARHAPPYSQSTGPIAISQRPVSQTTTRSCPSRLGTSGKQHSQEAESQGGLQHGARQRSRKRLSTPGRVRWRTA